MLLVWVSIKNMGVLEHGGTERLDIAQKPL